MSQFLGFGSEENYLSKKLGMASKFSKICAGLLGKRSIGSFDLFTQAVSKPKPAAPAMSQPFDDTNKTFDLEHPITFSTCSYTTELGLKILPFLLI